MKTCPPCHQYCWQGRGCPVRLTSGGVKNGPFGVGKGQKEGFFGKERGKDQGLDVFGALDTKKEGEGFRVNKMLRSYFKFLR